MRISITSIEQFRRYLAGEDTYEKFYNSITGKREETRFMMLGTALHEILEAPEKFKVSPELYKSSNGYSFDAGIVERCSQVIDYSGAFEMKTTGIYEVLGEQITIVGKCDQVIGCKVIENKTKWSPFDYDTYAASCQWRYYLEMFNVSAVKYNIFCMADLTHGIELKSIEVFEMHDYVGLQEDNRLLLSDYVHFIKSQNLETYFQEKNEYQSK